MESCELLLQTGGLHSRLTRCAVSYALSVVALFQQTVHTTDRELKTSLGRTRLGLGGRFTRSLAARLCFAAFSRHCEYDRENMGLIEWWMLRRGNEYEGAGVAYRLILYPHSRCGQNKVYTQTDQQRRDASWRGTKHNHTRLMRYIARRDHSRPHSIVSY